MEQSPVDKYAMRLHESIFEKIIGMLYIAKMKPLLKVAEKMLPDDEEFKAHLESLRYHNEELQKYLKNWCKYNPEHGLCKHRQRK